MVAVLVGTKCEISNQLSAVSNDIPLKNINSEKEKIPLDFLVKVGTLGFQLFDFLHHGMNIDGLFLFSCGIS